MSIDPTEIQGGMERRRAREMSLQRGRPPTQAPGYEPERFLGVGAYGEVWVAVERNTGRRVAIKYYAHRGGLDWSLLSREVEKLAFLFADRYVVQLLGVGWDADPPYYIMEYLEKGSLADRIAQGKVPVDEAVSLMRDVATGLVHAHGKGVLHCDLKPANVLLDQDGKPRLADFGQSRLSTEQAPALGHDVLHGPGAGRPRGRARRTLGRLRPGGIAVLHVDRRPAVSDGQDRGRLRADARLEPTAAALPRDDRAVAAAVGASQGAAASTRCWRRSSIAAWRSIRSGVTRTCKRCSTPWTLAPRVWPGGR